MKCPHCGSVNIRTQITKRIKNKVRRYRRCKVCNKTFRTIEQIDRINTDKKSVNNKY